jgi:hypothetical protein
MKKFLIFILSLVLLFIVSFSCSYAVYKKSNETSDNRLTIGETDKSSDNTENISEENETNKYVMEDISLYSTNDMDNVSDITSDAVNALSDSYNTANSAVDDTPTAKDNIENTETTENKISNGKNYIVRDYNGYVAVFTVSNSLYEFTDILVENLDSDLKKRVKNGILFEKEEELYTFLESCSS